MEQRLRIGVGILGFALVASCGGRALDMDGGMGTVTGAAGRAAGSAGIGGGSPTGGQSGAFGSGGFAGNVGSGGLGGVGGSSPIGRGGMGGFGRGGVTGTGGIAGIGGRGGTGGIGGSTGRGGVGGIAGDIGMSGRGGGGIGGFAGSGGIGGSFGSGGIGGIGGSARGGFGGEFGTAGRGGSIGSGGIGGSFGSGGSFAGTSGTGGLGGRGGTAGLGGRGGSGGTAGMGGMGGTVCTTCWSSLLPVLGQHVVYNPVRNEIYVSVAGDADAYPNTIVVVDPTTSAVTSAIPIGSNPSALALSDDGSTLWVGIDGAHAFRKVTMSSSPPVVGPLIRLTDTNRTTYYNATSMAVLRGAPLSVAVVMSTGQYSYANAVRIYDDGVPRPVAVEGTFTAVNVVAGPPGYVFGSISSPGYFFVYTITSSGVTQSTNYNVFRNFNTGTIAYSAGRVYSASGDVVDVANPASPTWVSNIGSTGPVAMLDAQNLLMLTNRAFSFPFTPGADIRVVSTSTFTLTSDVLLKDSVAPGPSGTAYRDLTYAGGDTVAFLRTDDNTYTNASRLAIVHDPAFGMSMGGGGGSTGTGGAGGMGGMGGMGGAPNPCPGCTFTAVQAYGHHFTPDPGRHLLYVSSGAQSPVHPSTIVTVDATASAVTSIVPVGNDPEPLALSDDGSALWVGLAGERRVRRMTPGPTPAPGAAYTLPMLLTTNEMAVPFSIVVLPGAPGSIAVSVYGLSYGSQGVFILDDGLPRANFIQPPEVASSFLINGPPGYLLGIGQSDNLVVYRIATVGATMESYAGLVSSSQTGFVYSGGFAYASQGEVIDLTNPDAPLPAGRFAFSSCVLAVRSTTRVLMMCPSQTGAGPILRVLDSANFVSVGSVTLPDSLNQGFADIAYLGGDAIALLGYDFPLQVMHAPIIGSPP